MNRKITLLSLDGGGIRGIISCIILKYIEEQLQQKDHPQAKLGDYFDLIAGTSTGGLITALLLCPDEHQKAKFSVTEALALYTEKGASIFDVSFWDKLLNPFGLLKEKIDDTPLEHELAHVFGTLELRHLIKPCLITAYDITARKATFFTSHNAENPLRNFRVTDVCRATSAAPSYFEPAQVVSLSGEQFTLIDGGVYANNPALCAYAEARKIPFSKVLNHPEKPDYPTANDMIVVSVGTGTVLKPYAFDDFKNAGKVEWITPLIDILLSSNVETVNYQMQKMYESLGNENTQHYFRLMPELLKASSEMDDTTPENIQNLIQDGLTFVRKNQVQLDQIVQKLLDNR